MKIGRIITLLIVLGAIAGGAYWYWQKSRTSDQPAIMSSEVKRGDIEVTVLASGTLRPARLVAVGAQVSGQITSVKVAVGQTVKAGDMIAEIDSLTQETTLKTKQAALDYVKAQRLEKAATLKLNEQDLGRQENMVSKNAVSRSDYESAVAAVAVTKAQLQQLDAQILEAELAVEAAKVDLGYTRITAPIDGTVLSVVSQQGQTVNASSSTPTIVILGQLDKMVVRTEISEADISRVSTGLPVYFSVVGAPEKRYDASLESIDPAPDSIKSDSSLSTSSSSSSSSSSSTSAIYYYGTFTVDNPEGKLRTYMTAEVHIVLGQAKGALVIPSSALKSPGKDGLYSVRVIGADGGFERRKIKIGLNNKVQAEVLSGLEAGERIVTGEVNAALVSRNSRSPRLFGGPPGM